MNNRNKERLSALIFLAGIVILFIAAITANSVIGMAILGVFLILISGVFAKEDKKK